MLLTLGFNLGIGFISVLCLIYIYFEEKLKLIYIGLTNFEG